MHQIEFIRSDIFYLSIDVLVACLIIVSMTVRRDSHIVVAVFTVIALIFKLVIFVGFRPFDAGNDTIGYYYTFQSLEGVSSARDVGGMYGGTEKASELLYWPIAAFLKSLLGDSFRLFLIVSILICGYFTYLGNKKLVDPDCLLDRKKRFALSVVVTYLVFLSFELVYFGGHIRSAFGIPLALLSYYFASKKNIAAAAILLFFAIGFHTSAISILPLLLIEIFTPNIRQSRRVTLFIVVSLMAFFVFGMFGGVGGIMNIIGGYYSDRYTAYVEYEGFNITSIFATAYFWIILMYLILFLVIGYRKVHFYAFYYMCLVLIFSSAPKISERFFAYILVCLPFLLYASLRTRFGEGKSIFLTVALSYAINPLVITSYAVTSTLSIHSYIYPR